MPVALPSPGAPRPTLPDPPRQMLPREAYVGQEWFEWERQALFGRTWSFAGPASEIGPRGYLAADAGAHRMFVLRDDDGTLRAFHNLCRHRGTELLEGAGRLPPAGIVCPYHRWTYDLDGALRAVPMQRRCFPDLDRAAHRLFAAAVGELRGMLFVHPDPCADFPEWKTDLDSVAWPHELAHMTALPAVTYEMRCNWKVFVENAIDGYHLAYLHDRTLGGPPVDRNVWDVHGRHLVWYSTESGRKTCMPEAMAGRGHGRIIPGAESGDYGGVFVLFPDTIVTADPTSFTVSKIVPVSPDLTRLVLRQWTAKESGWKWPAGGGGAVEDSPGYDPESGYLKLAHLGRHPRDSGDFHWEDVWVCEKMQRALGSPMHRVGALAKGPGAEAPLAFFQQNVCDYLGPEARAPSTTRPPGSAASLHEAARPEGAR